jgi:mRNA-degrading endonuclease toxin of MazEF toxin-antitoxin module
MLTKISQLNQELTNLATNCGSNGGSKRIEIYLDWLLLQREIFENELAPMNIPEYSFPSTVDSYRYGLVRHKTEFLLYYYLNPNNKYIRNTTSMTQQHKELLLDDLVTYVGRVFWMQLGVNVGSEFGGRHRVIVLRNLGESLLIAPITSGVADPNKDYQVDLHRYYGFRSKPRYANVFRIKPLSKRRIEFDRSNASVHSSVVTNIITSYKHNVGI